MKLLTSSKLIARAERVAIVNQLVRTIGDNGRQFFYNKQTGEYARMHIGMNGRLYWIDERSLIPIYLHSPGSRWRDFSHGGTLRYVIEKLKGYAMTGEPVPNQFGPWKHHDGSDFDLWGYGDDMVAVRETAVELGIVEASDDSK